MKLLNILNKNILLENINQSVILSQMVSDDQKQRKEYMNFVKNNFDGDYKKGAIEYRKLKKTNDIFGDDERLKKFVNIKFNFENFNEDDWHNYWLLTQHCDVYPNFQISSLKIIKKYLGTNNDNYRYLHDRISCAKYGTQKYNTQNICEKR